MAVLFVLALALSGAPRLDTWQILGPGGGGAQFRPTVSPHDPKLVMVACDMTGSYISHDGGDTWRMFNLRGVSRFFAYHPAEPDTLYAGAGALWRSTDRGKTWRVLYPEPGSITGSDMMNDHAGETLLVNGNPLGRLLAFAIHPKQPERMYLAVRNDASTQLLASSDSGKTWKLERELTGDVRQIYVRNDGVLHIIGDNAVTAGEKSGAALEGIEDVSAGWKADGELVVYAVTSKGGFVSENSGATWRPFHLPGSGAQMRAIATSLQHPGTAYVSYSRLDGTWFGVAKTVDYGKTWTLPWRDAVSEPAKNVEYAWIAERFGSRWAGHPLTLGVSPVDPSHVFATDFGRTTRSTDGGATWKTLFSRRVPDAGWVSTGLDVTTAYGVHFDPFDPKRIFISYTDIGAFHSEDGGKTWVSSTTGVPRQWRNTTYWIEFDPKVKGRAWAVFSGTHDLPRPKMWRTNSPAKYQGGAGISDDGGRTWTPITTMPETAATHIVLDPTSPVDARVLYVAGFGRGVFKSTDGGKTWALKNEGLPANQPFAWRIERDRNGRLYLIIARRSEDGSIGTPEDGALYYSDDGAEHWTKLTLPEGVNGPNGLAIDPDNPKRLYLAAWARRSSDTNTTGGIFLSTDAGRSWKHMFAGDQHVYDVTIDPRDLKKLYACGFESSAWRSEDRGATWRRIRGYNFKWGHRVIADPRDPANIFITTFGGSVWHGPAAGDPKAKEDIEAPWVK